MVVHTTDQLPIVSFTQDEQGLLDKVKSYDESCTYLNKLQFAIEFSKKAHSGQKRASGEDYFIHPLAVAHILASLEMDSLTIISALLHDVVEDTEVTLDTIREHFGEEVTYLVDGVTKLSKVEVMKAALVKTENFKKLMLATSKDIRALIIKLADRLHNMQTLSHVSSITKRQRIASETMQIYAPIAERIGMHSIKSQLQNLAFEISHKYSRDSIVQRLDAFKEGNSKLISDISETLVSLLASYNVDAKVIGRGKTPFSIWEKMKTRNINFGQLSDVVAFRVIVSDVDACYKALGIIHCNYRMVPGHFRDFISLPKQNMYKALHTVVIWPARQKIEIQIRTEEMHRIAESGIAAHWSYKQLYKDEDREGHSWINGLIHLSETSKSYEEFLENAKSELSPHMIACFTPKGNLITLPKGASSLDFAYAVHSDIGNACVGAIINGKTAPIKTKLQDGDQVTIITSSYHTPLPGYEHFVITGKALHNIRQSVKREKDRHLAEVGRDLLMQVYLKQNQEFSLEAIELHLALFKKATITELLCAVAENEVRPEEIFKAVYPTINIVSEMINDASSPDSKDEQILPEEGKMPIKGVPPGVHVHTVSCCYPIHGDNILGLKNANSGITVHALPCEMRQYYEENPDLLVNVSWQNNPEPGVFIESINIVLQNSLGALAEITSAISENKSNIVNIVFANRSHDFFEINFDVTVKDIHHLTDIITTIRSLVPVQSANRRRNA